MKRKPSDSGLNDPERDETPETPLDEPQPIPVQDPPPTDSPAPYVVRRERVGRDESRPRIEGACATRSYRYLRIGARELRMQKLLNMEEHVRKARVTHRQNRQGQRPRQ